MNPKIIGECHLFCEHHLPRILAGSSDRGTKNKDRECHLFGKHHLLGSLVGCPDCRIKRFLRAITENHLEVVRGHRCSPGIYRDRSSSNSSNGNQK